ncbi:MAG: hypothetical protein SVU32_03575, partial [Candidatus Nanohaloarchaea archaeon]|nr:hypothetical protein [Candidatus Nanohaloarchaea archaeon]
MDWDAIRTRFEERSKQKFREQRETAMGVEDEIAHLDPDSFESLTRDSYQQTLDRLGEQEGIDLKYEDDSPWTDVPVAALVHDSFFEEELADLDGFFPDEGFFPQEYDDVVAEVSYDLSNELEKATGVNLGLHEAHVERRLIDELKLDAVPQGTGLYRLGHVPGLIVDDVDDFYDRERFDEDGCPTQEESRPYMTQKRRYVDHLKSHGTDVMAIGGTDSIQVTMRPRMESDVDTMFADFYSGEGDVGMSALAPLLYAPFMSSPVLGEDGGLESHMGREWAYSKGLDDSDYSDDQKYGFIEELTEVDGLADVMDVFAKKTFQFSAGVEAGGLEVVGEDGTLDEVYGDEHTQLASDTAVNVRVGHGEGTMTFQDFVDERAFEGIVSLPAEGEEDGDEVVVRADYERLDDDAFVEEAWKHFIAHSSGVWPNFNPRFDVGAFESRDFGNSPRIKEAVDTQAGAFLRWRELERYADEVLDLTNNDAAALRDGVAREGLDYELPNGMTVREAWYGPDREDGLLDIVKDGVRDAAYGPSFGDSADAEGLRDTYRFMYGQAMEEYLEEGTYSEVFAELYREEGLAAAMADACVGDVDDPV